MEDHGKTVWPSGRKEPVIETRMGPCSREPRQVEVLSRAATQVESDAIHTRQPARVAGEPNKVRLFDVERTARTARRRLVIRLSSWKGTWCK
jgi:hypothetical protein